MGIFINVSFTSLSPILPHPRCPSLHSLRWSLDFIAALPYRVSSLCPVSTLPFLLLFLSKYLVRLRVYFCIFSASGRGLVTQHLWKCLLRGTSTILYICHCPPHSHPEQVLMGPEEEPKPAGISRGIQQPGALLCTQPGHACLLVWAVG